MASWARDAATEAWLRDLITAFGNPPGPPPGYEFSNLDSLAAPCQLLCLTTPVRGGREGVVLLLQDSAVAHGMASAIYCSDIESIAAFADGCSELPAWGTTAQKGLLPWLSPTRNYGQIAAVELGQVLADPNRNPVAGFAVPHRQMLQAHPAAALWHIRYEEPLPTPTRALEFLGRRREPSPQANTQANPAPPEEAPRRNLYAAGFEPPLWFGPPPFPSASESVRGTTIIQKARRSQDTIVASTTLPDGTVLRISTKGIVFVECEAAATGERAINLVFGAALLLGVGATAISPVEILTFTSPDPDTLESLSGGGVVTTRNDRFTWASQSSEPFLEVRTFDDPAKSAALILETAVEVSQDRARALALHRILDSFTSVTFGKWTESFILSWSVIESSLWPKLESKLQEVGVSKPKIQTREWTASRQIDLLLATGSLDIKDYRDLEELRRIRNRLVHDLSEATAQEAQTCLTVAQAHAQLTPKPLVQPIRFRC